MDRILKAGQLAPTAVNFQPQKIFILKSKEAIQKIRTLTHFAYDAPVVLLFCADTTKVWRSPTEHGYDISLAHNRFLTYISMRIILSTLH